MGRFDSFLCVSLLSPGFPVSGFVCRSEGLDRLAHFRGCIDRSRQLADGNLSEAILLGQTMKCKETLQSVAVQVGPTKETRQTIMACQRVPAVKNQEGYAIGLTKLDFSRNAEEPWNAYWCS